VKEVRNTPTEDLEMKRLETVTEELTKRVKTLEEQNNTLIHRLTLLEQKDTGWEGGEHLSSEVKELSQANNEIRENMRKLSADAHETLGPVRLKTIFETFLGELGWKGRHRAKWCEQTYKEKDGLLSKKTLIYFNSMYAAENPDNTTHATTFSKGYAAVEMEYGAGRMTEDDYLAFLAILAYLHDKKNTDTTDTDIDTIRRRVLDPKQRTNLRRVLRRSSAYLRAPRPKPMLQYVKSGEKVDETWLASSGARRDIIAKELEEDGVVVKELVVQAVSPLSTKGGKAEKKKAKDTGHISKKGRNETNTGREVEKPGWK
jgi:hypothetical protein